MLVGLVFRGDYRETYGLGRYGPAAMASGVALREVPPRTLRLSGTELTPTWRGWSHLLALIGFGPAAAALVWHQAGDPAVLLYATALLALFAVSAGYHLLPLSPTGRAYMRRADHAMIYLFTAASYTPFCLRAVPGTLGLVVLAAAWAGALVGVALKVFGFARTQITSSVLYIMLGWLATLTLPGAARILTPGELALLLAMGAMYSGGAVVLWTRRPDPIPHIFGYHEVWHASVVLASACYFAFVWGLPAR